MALIASIRFGTGIDQAGLSAGLAKTGREIDKFTQGKARALRSIPAPRVEAPKAVGGDVSQAASGQAAELAAALLPVAAQVKKAVWAAVQPLTQFAAKFAAQFDKVGGALIGISERIDAAMKFPKFEQRIVALRGWVKKWTGLIPKDVADSAKLAGAVHPQLDAVANPFELMSGRVRAAVVQIPEALRHAVHQAEQVRANLGPLVGDFEVAARTARAPVAPPDDGKGYGLDKGARSRAAQARRRVGGKFAPAASGFTPTPATEDQLPARVRPAAPVVSGKWEVQPVADQLRDGAKAMAEATAKVGALSGAVRSGMAVFGPWGKAASAGIAVATGAYQAGAATIGGSMRLIGRTVDLGLGAYLKWTKVREFFASLGSVAEKTIGRINAIKPPPFKFDLSTTINQITRVGAVAQAATAPVGNFFKSFAVGLGAFGLAFKAAQFVKDGVAEASNLNETVSATDAILGKASDAVKSFSDQMAADFGHSKREMLETAQGFAGLAKGLGGLDGKALSDFSIQMSKMAADGESFKNIPLKEMAEAMRTTLSGEQSDTLKKMGILINDDSTKAYALAHGMAEVGKEVKDEVKFAARAKQLLEGLKDAQGDLEKTQYGAANQLRKLTGSIRNLGASIGEALLPILTRGLNLMNKFVGAGGKLFAGSKGAIEGFAATVGAAIGKVEAVVMQAMPSVLAFGQQIIAAIGGAIASVYGLLPSFSTVVDFGKVAFASVAGAITSVYRWVVAIPGAIDGAFGAGTFGMALKLAGVFAAVALAVGTIGPMLAGVVPVVVGVVSSCLGWVPAVAAVATGVMALTGRFVSVQDVVSGLGFALRNAGDLAGIAWAYVSDRFDQFRQVLGAIPQVLATVAGYIRDNWLSVLTGTFFNLVKVVGSAVAKVASLLWEGFKGAASLVGKVLWELPGLVVSAVGAACKAIAGFFANIWGNLKSFGDAIVKFVKNPTKGFDWNLPELKLPEIKSTGQGDIDKRLAALDAKEKAFQADMGKPYELPKEVAAAPQVAPPPVVAADPKKEFDTAKAKKAQTELEAFAKQFKTKVETPLEEYTRKMGLAQQAFDKGLLTKEEFANAKQFASHEAGLDKEVKVAGAVELGSKEANSTLASAFAGKVGGISSVEKINAQQLAVQREQLAEQRKANKGKDKKEPVKEVHI